ncbi:MAG: hypothetical protein ABI570_06335 [Ilumatobacteraceae bacterium]
MDNRPELDVAGLLSALNKYGVRFVLIGGIAAQIHNLPVPATIDVDITPARDEGNLGRLAEVFEELKAGLLTVDDTGAWFPRHPVENWAQYDTLHLVTQYGLLDIVFTPDGAPRGFDDLESESVEGNFGTVAFAMISKEQWIRLKTASGRAKDLEHLARYYESLK